MEKAGNAGLLLFFIHLLIYAYYSQTPNQACYLKEATMKFFVSIFTALALALCVTACGDKDEDTAEVQDSGVDVQDSGTDAGDSEGSEDAGAEE